MKRLALLPLIALALAACSDTTTTAPTVSAPDLRLNVAAGTYLPTLDDAAAPSGTHLQTGAIGCTVNADLSIDCSSYELAGVGHTNADVALEAVYRAIVDCFNPGDPSNKNNPIESHTTGFSASDDFTARSSKNGRLTVRAAEVDPALVPQGCPNVNWQPLIRPGSLQLVSFSYTLTFEAFTAAYITISAS